jgi:hypothetical protein
MSNPSSKNPNLPLAEKHSCYNREVGMTGLGRPARVCCGAAASIL